MVINPSHTERRAPMPSSPRLSSSCTTKDARITAIEARNSTRNTRRRENLRGTAGNGLAVA
jgi:hypothetical protein